MKYGGIATMAARSVSLGMCPLCNTPLLGVPLDEPPFPGAPEGRWMLLYCPGDGCAWEGYAREGHLDERWTRDGRRFAHR